MKYAQINRVDIAQGEATLTASIGDQIILSKYHGKPWTVGEDVALQDIVTAGVALLEFLAQEVHL